MRTHPRRRSGATLLETTLALAIVSVLAGIVVPRAAAGLDRYRVRAAAERVATAYAVARAAAIYRQAFVALTVEESTGRLAVTAAGDTLLALGFADEGVAIHTSRARSTFSPQGLGWGAANASVVLTRGRASDSVVVSRLGRVRRASGF